MPSSVQDIYTSANGDRWQFVRDGPQGSLLVRHTANASSGGQVTKQTVGQFLSVDGPGPEFVALRRLLADAANE